LLWRKGNSQHQPKTHEGTDANSRIPTGISHRQDAGLGVGSVEVLITEGGSVDRLATGALGLCRQCVAITIFFSEETNVTAGEVAALQHELRDDSVEGRALVAKPFLASAEGSEVLRSLGDYIIVELEVDPTRVSCRSDGSVSQEATRCKS
jgi:hypothetical protein